MVSRHEQIRQRRHDEQPVAVLCHAAIADLGEAEDAFDDQEGMLDLGAHTRFPAVRFPLPFRELLVAESLLVGEVARLGRSLGNQFLLAGIGRVAIHPPLVAVQEIGDAVLVMFVGWRGDHRVDQLVLAVHTDVRLHAKVPLVALLRLVHLRVARLVTVLGRGRRGDDGGIDDGAGRDLQPLGLQMPANFLEQALAQFVALQQVAKLAGGGLVRSAFPSQIDAHKFAHGQGIVESFFNRRVGEVEPVLEEVDTQHALKPDGRTPVASLRVDRFDQFAQLLPWHHAVHLGKKRCAPGLFGVAVKAARRKCRLFHRFNPFVQPELLTA